jgi:transcriptional regulator with XRE-family HTH domain
LKKIRAEKKISQSDLAYECGMEVSQISRMERGLLNTSISNIFLISKVLNIHPKEMLSFDVSEKAKRKI